MHEAKSRKKMSIAQYIEREFVPGSEPAHKTVINWIKAGIIDGIEIGGKYYVYLDNGDAQFLIAKVLKAV